MAKRKLAFPLLVALALPAFFAGCTKSGDLSTPFIVLKTEPANNGRIFLNQKVQITFTNEIDLTTANFNSVAFFVFDAQGNPLSEQVVGKFQYGKNTDDVEDQRILEFIPRLPSNDTYSNGGFKPARRYRVSLIGTTNQANPTLRDKTGRPLSVNSPIQTLEFQTASGSTPQELFLDREIGGPRVSNLQIGPLVGTRVSLNRMGGVPVELRIDFNQPLNPHSTNVPLRQDLDPRQGLRRNKGKIFIEYDDVELGKRRWIPTDVEMPRNDLTGATVVLRPDGVLPNSADVRIIIEAELQDISGESNVKDASYNRIIGAFKTETAYEAQWDAVIMDFETNDLADPEAAFRDPVATVTDGVVRAAFDFQGLQTPFDYGPTTKEVILSTDFTTVVPRNGPPIAVTGGVFSFHNIEIPKGVTVRGVGTNPMVWLATGEVLVDGHLHVNGGDGGQVDTLNAANFPTAGGIGVCTGGNGGKASQSVTSSTQQGEHGYGPNQRPNRGGVGGRLSCQGSKGSGGGGGSQATTGDPDYYSKKTTPENGVGGPGSSSSGPTAGGAPGPKVFEDELDDNDFWGRHVDPQGNVTFGELNS
ncbi:MAG: hypothetical protein CMJ85_11660, partial [Planctomycetes bacterium]|nr:hypothetical protein [Planctomycetota bacterium]